VKPLGREVSSRYASDAFFQQKSPSSGELFNVRNQEICIVMTRVMILRQISFQVVNKHELERKEKQLLTAIVKLKARLQWLTSGRYTDCCSYDSSTTNVLDTRNVYYLRSFRIVYSLME